ncbi:MAG: hypothetical protein WC856_27005, partial [Methylococcaceae bacterium]
LKNICFGQNKGPQRALFCCVGHRVILRHIFALIFRGSLTLLTPGRATIEVATLASFKHFEKWANLRWQHRGEEYEEFKRVLSMRLLDELERHVPAVKGNIDYWELSTPVSTQHFTNHPTGEMYGLAHTPERFNARWLGARTPIRNLLLTGQDVMTGGVTGAMFGGGSCRLQCA